MSFRYTLRTPDGVDACEVVLGQRANTGEEIRISGNRRMRVRAVVPTELLEEFIEARALYGFLEVEPIAKKEGHPPCGKTKRRRRPWGEN